MNSIKTLILALLATGAAYGHCQVPCGIYDDNTRVLSMQEDAATVAKACKMIAELSEKKDAQSQNQLTRWVVNKESHAQSIIATISDYFLTQRVKTSQKDYVERLTKHHAVILAAMKAKQNADGKFAEALSKAIDALAAYYPAAAHKH
ncbi:MAG: superoxide dismutase [Lentisphaeria bacterium]|nr:superoxide dismutase [Lentisphaeria bacterium]